MARLATTSDAFSAVAEPRRREILDLLARGERSVNDMARMLRLRQPQVSKHLRVLRQVGLVGVRGSGRQRLYSLSGAGLKPIHDRAGQSERFWSESFDRLADRLDEPQRQENSDGHSD
jgi:DNA-binding transcriptional ArsR family regulator